MNIYLFLNKLFNIKKVRILVIFFVIILGIIRIGSCYSVFSHTVDEPAHIACGMEFLSTGSYTIEYQHPPLTRVMMAIGPYLYGIRSTWDMFKHNEGIVPPMWQEGLSLLSQKDYKLTLTLARVGNLFFYVIACLATYLISSSYYGYLVGILSVFIFSFIPEILGQSGLAMTDMGVTAFMGLSIFSFHNWIKSPNILKTLILSVMISLSLLAKFTALMFLPLFFLSQSVVYYLNEKKDGNISSFSIWVLSYCRWGPLFFLVMFLSIWTGYGFSLNPLFDTGSSKVIALIKQHVHGHLNIQNYIIYLINAPIWPLREFIGGILNVIGHNNVGHSVYFLGMVSSYGWWYYFPTVLFIKTPLTLWLLSTIGIFSLLKIFKDKEKNYNVFVPIVISIAILISVMPSNLNLGVRHILIIYILLSPLAALGFLFLIKRNTIMCNAIGFSILLAFIYFSFLSHANYLSFRNALFKTNPENYLVEMDMGQDFNLLLSRLETIDAKSVAIDCQGHWRNVDPLFPAYAIEDFNKAEYIAISLRQLALFPEKSKLLDKFSKVELIGTSIMLYKRN